VETRESRNTTRLEPGRSQSGQAASGIDQSSSQSTAQYGGPLKLWYQLTAPPPPPANASIQQRQLAARGKLTSEILLLVIIMVLAAEPVAIYGPNKSLIFILLIPIFINIIALIFNRNGQLIVAGIMVIVGVEVGVLLSILGPALGAGGLTTYSLPQYDLLVQATLVAVTLLPPRSVFWVVLFHAALTIATILYLPHSAEFARILAANEYDLLLRPMELQIIVAFVTYRWVTNADQAIQRADRAEEIAMLERRELELQQKDIETKQALEYGVEQILKTLQTVSGGYDFSARVPLSQENILWRVSYAINNLLSRLQGFKQERNELESTRKLAAQVVQYIQQGQRIPLPPGQWTRTSLDPIIVAWNKRFDGPAHPAEARKTNITGTP